MKRLFYLLVALVCSAAIAQTALFRSFNSGEVGPDVYGRTDTHLPGGRVIENMFVWPHGPVEKRSGTAFIAEVASGEISGGAPGIPGAAANYVFTQINENGSIWYIPLGDGEMNLGLDVDGIAVDGPAATVDLPMTDHPFAVGDVVRISNTTSYNNQFTLAAGTTADTLRVASAFNAETFDGTEIVIKNVSLTSSAGRMVQDTSGNLYYGHTWSAANSTYITKVETDGTLVYDFLSTAWPLEGNAGSSLLGIAITADDAFLYLAVNVPLITPHHWVEKYNLATGNLVWSVQAGIFIGYDIDIDSDGNCYVALSSLTKTAKLASADGALTSINNSYGVYEILVDDSMGVIISAGKRSFPNALHNLFVTSLALDENDSIGVGGADGLSTWTIGTGMLTTLDDVIYVVSLTPTATLYKITWDGSSLSVVDSVVTATDAQGIFVDIYGNLVVVNQEWVTGVSDVFYYYDSNLTLLGTIDGFHLDLLTTWASAAGGAFIQGNAFFDGTLATDSTPATPAVTIPASEGVAARLLTFERTNIIEAGHGYMRFYKDVP